jgi:hypothetical protein
MKIAIGSVVAVLAAFVLITWWAAESSGVAVIETRAADGSPRATHVWFAEPDGELWLEAGTPENSWYVDVRRDSHVSFSSAERAGEYTAEPVEARDAHDRIRSLFREKYGVRDWWIGLFFDTSRSVAVQLVPAPA